MENLDWFKQQLKRLTLSELEVLEGWIQEQKQLISQVSSQPSKKKSKRRVVKAVSGHTPSGKEALWQLEYVRCGKPRCQKCTIGDGHGPYWYYYWRESSRDKLKSKYWGKRDPLI